MNDYYQVLGITQSANQGEIQAAFRKLALQFHPDKNPLPEAHERFVEIVEAYEILKDTERKMQYDNWSEAKTAMYDNEYREYHDKDIFNEWSRGAYERANSYAKMSFEEFSEVLKNLMMEAAFHGEYYYAAGFITYVWILGGVILFLLGLLGFANNEFSVGLLFIIGGAASLFKGIRDVKIVWQNYKYAKRMRKKL